MQQLGPNKRWTPVWVGEAARLGFLFPAMRVWTPLTVRGLENLDPVTSYIFAANHSSHLDTPLVLAALPQQQRVRTRVAAADDYFFVNPLKGWFVATLLNAFPFQRKGLGGVLTAAHLLTSGHSLLLFPEGTRTKTGRLQPFKQGVGRLAAMSGVAIVPVWIEGTATAMPKGSRFPHHQAVSVTFGAPLHLSEHCDPVAAAEDLAQRVRALVNNTRELAA